jgi:putative DNA primase/helicase
MHAAEIARIAHALGGAVRDGQGWRCHCPVHVGADSNLSLQPGDAVPLLARCWSHSCDPRKVLAELRHRGLLDEGHDDGRRRVLPQSQPRHVKPASIDSRNVALAISTWNESEADHPILRRYLAGRGLDGGQVDALRFHRRCPRGQDRLPAMVGKKTDFTTGEFRGIHRTYLLPDGNRKAPVKPNKMVLGSSAGAVIRLIDDAELTTHLGIAEGIESAIAASTALGTQAMWLPVWSAIDAGNLSRLPVLHGVEWLTIFSDHDPSGTEQGAARMLAARWHAAGREVFIAQPPAAAGEKRAWNDGVAA